MAAPTLTPTGIRTDLVTRLTGASALWTTVWDSREVDAADDELPCLTIKTAPDATEDRQPQRGLVHLRKESVHITGLTKATVSPPADIDAATAAAVCALEDAIRDRLFGDSEWLEAFNTIGYKSTKSSDTDGRTFVAGVGITLELEYHVQYAPIVAADDLHAVAVTTDTTDPAGADVSERIITLVGP